jgi:hypothetical protein
LQRARDVLLRAVKQAREEVEAGLRGIELRSEPTLAPGQVDLQFVGSGPSPPERLRARIFASGLRSCADGLGLALLWARREAALWTLPGNVVRNESGGFTLEARFTSDQWNEVIVKGGLRFDRLPLPEKFSELGELGVSDVGLVGDIVSLNAARNCLVHRAGIVGPEDLRDGKLVISWRRMRASLRATDGSIRLLEVPMRVEAGEVLQLRTEPVERAYVLGDALEISEEDFRDMAQTYVLFGQPLEAAVLAMQERRFSDQGASRAGEVE